MRPDVLNPLFAPLSGLRGAGPKTAAALKKLCGERIVDLLFHLPESLINRRRITSISEAAEGEVVTLRVKILRHVPAARKGLPSRVQAEDMSGNRLDIVFFHVHGNYLEKILPPGDARFVSGKAEYFQGKAQIAHPDHIAETAAEIPEQEPV